MHDPGRDPVARRQPCIEAFFAALREVRAVRVLRQDGTITTVTTEPEARELLASFGWVPPG
jgi:hypothetical protein